MEFTGERVIPGMVEPDLWAEHLSRYVFAGPLVHGRRVLDLGTGTGYGAQAIAGSARSVVGVDVSPEAVAYANRHHRLGRRVSFSVGAAQALPFRDDAFDAVVCFEVIEHVSEQAELLAEVRRVLAPQGVFIVSTPNRLYYTDERHEHNEFHVREFELEEFLDFLRPVFPKLQLYLQNHVPAVVIDAPNGTSTGRASLARMSAEVTARAIKTAHYGVVVCADDERSQADGVVFFPEGSGNVLREREVHIRALLDDAEGTKRAFEDLRKDWEARGNWTKHQDKELLRTQQAHARAAHEAEGHARMVQSLDIELRRTQGIFQSLEIDFRERSAQLQAVLASADELRVRASRAEEELGMARGEAVALRQERDDLQGEAARMKELSADHAARLKALEAAQRDVLRQLHEALRPGVLVEAARLGRNVARDLLRLVARSTLPFAAAGAAVPLAGAIGAGALAIEAIAGLLPRRRALQSLAPLDTSLATLAILNYDGRDLLAKNIPFCQAAIARTGRPHEILVIDNGSTDGSVELLRDRFPGVKVLALPKNLFFSRGYDAGLHAASHDIVVLLNNDMRVEPDFLEPLLEPFRADASVFAVASRILMAKGMREETGLTRGRFEAGRLELRHEPVSKGAMQGTQPILWAGGGAAAFDKRKFFEIGGLDVLYDPFYCEDTDLSLRAWQRGWKVLFSARSEVWHDHRTTTRRVFGEAYVNETVRRNMLLLQWANLRDRGSLLQHLVHLPAIAFDDARLHGLSGAMSLARAAARAPRALARRLRERPSGPSLQDVLVRIDAGADPTVPRPPKLRSKSDPLRIVMVAPYHVYPIQHGGAVRMYNVLRGMAQRGHDVSLVGFVDNEEQREAGERHLLEFCSEVRLLLRAAKPKPPPWDLVPEVVKEFEDKSLRRELGAMLERRDADVLQIEYTHMASYVEPSNRRIACLAEIDVAFMSLYRHALALKGVAAIEAHLHYLKMFRWELQALRSFDLVFTMNRRDAVLLRRMVGGAVQFSDRAPVPVDTTGFVDVQRKPLRDSMLFVGNFAHTPNSDAIRYFMKAIAPEIWKRAPEARLVIAGKNPPEDIRRLADDRRIEVTGFVEDLRPYYASAGVFVSPVRVAAGVRVKILEAFAAGVPVVSTSPGAEGLDVLEGRDALIADEPSRFAEATVRLLRDRELASRVGAAGRSFVEERYSVSALSAALDDEYRSALRRKQLERGES